MLHFHSIPTAYHFICIQPFIATLLSINMIFISVIVILGLLSFEAFSMPQKPSCLKAGNSWYWNLKVAACSPEGSPELFGTAVNTIMEIRRGLPITKHKFYNYLNHGTPIDFRASLIDGDVERMWRYLQAWRSLEIGGKATIYSNSLSQYSHQIFQYCKDNTLVRICVHRDHILRQLYFYTTNTVDDVNLKGYTSVLATSDPHTACIIYQNCIQLL